MNNNTGTYKDPRKPQWFEDEITYDEFSEKYNQHGVNSSKNPYTYSVNSMSTSPEAIEILIHIYQVVNAGDEITFKMTKPITAVVLNSEQGESKIQLDSITFDPEYTYVENGELWPDKVHGYSGALGKEIIFSTWNLEGFDIR